MSLVFKSGAPSRRRAKESESLRSTVRSLRHADYFVQAQPALFQTTQQHSLIVRLNTQPSCDDEGWRSGVAESIGLGYEDCDVFRQGIGDILDRLTCQGTRSRSCGSVWRTSRVRKSERENQWGESRYTEFSSV